MTTGSTIVLLNGVGSSGKSSIARAMQAMTREPFLHVPMDAFAEMLPEALQDHADGFAFASGEEAGKPVVAIRTGPVGARLIDGMRHAIAAMATRCNNLIVDDVILDGGIADYRRLLAGLDFRTVGVFARLDLLEDRERNRGDRLIGLARWQYDRVHSDIVYDLEVDSSSASPEACARVICHTFGL